MNPETKRLLQKFDERGAFEFPRNFNYDDLERRAKQVYEDIQQFGLQVGFEGAVYNQDASFSISILLHDFKAGEASMMCQSTIRFSNFGSLATICFVDQVIEKARVAIFQSLERHGFIYVCADELDCEYDGVMDDKKNIFRTWWIRYFDWL